MTKSGHFGYSTQILHGEWKGTDPKMKITGFTRLFALLFCAAMLCSCAKTQANDPGSVNPEPTSTPISTSVESGAEEPEASSAPMSTPSNVEQESTQNQQISDGTEQNSPAPEQATAQSAGTSMWKEYTDLSFLTPEQQELYKRAYNLYVSMQDGAINLINMYDQIRLVESGGEIEDRRYISSGSQFVGDLVQYELFDIPYDAFTAMMLETFDSGYLNHNLHYNQNYINYQGQLAANCEYYVPSVAGAHRWVWEENPDTYRLVSSDEVEVRFILVAHYDFDERFRGPNSGSVTPCNVYTIEYPICFENTPDGWRVTEFHSYFDG